MEDLRVPKRRTALEIQLLGGAVHRVAVFLSDHAPGHAGPERVLDLLNGPDDFVPAHELETDALTYLNRSAVLLARLPSSTDEAEAGLESGASDHEVEITLTDGTKMQGRLTYAMPWARSRLSDFLNVAPLFFRLLEREQIVFINKAHVARLAEIRS
jgi:hypothetical protein